MAACRAPARTIPSFVGEEKNRQYLKVRQQMPDSNRTTPGGKTDIEARRSARRKAGSELATGTDGLLGKNNKHPSAR